MTPISSETFPSLVEELVSADAHLASVVAAHGIPAFWHRPPGFATLALFIVEQQVSLQSAKAVYERLADLLGSVEPHPVHAADLDDLGRAGLTRQKQRYLKLLAAAVLEGRLDLDGLEALPDDEVRRRLLRQIGIGPWTADVYLLSALRRPDVWPTGDRALQVGVGDLLGAAAPPTPDELETIGQRWRPHRSVAARLVWHDYLCRRGRATEVAGLGPITDGSRSRD